MNKMKHEVVVLGIDVGYSLSTASNAYCCLRINHTIKEIDLLVEPQTYIYSTVSSVYKKLFSAISNISIVTIDAPLTPVLIQSKPSTGRTIDKVFSNYQFSNGYRGPQPGSISTPYPGWNLYLAGMDTVSKISSLNYLLTYRPFSDCETGNMINGIFEVIPKLTQSLLVPQSSVTCRNKAKIDDYCFPRLFDCKGPDYKYLKDILGEYNLSERLTMYISEISDKPQRNHEELAAIVAAVQGALMATGKATIIGVEGEDEGYYALPHISYWQSVWADSFYRSILKYDNVMML